MQVQQVMAAVRSNVQLAPGHGLIVLKVDKPLEQVEAGQFLSLQCVPHDNHSLLRPFSILDYDSDLSTLSVYYKHLGRLSSQLAEVPEGARLRMVYPLGQPFPWHADWRRIALVGGGVGIAPLLLLKKQLATEPLAPQCDVFIGGANTTDLVIPLLAEYGVTEHFATMDGSTGHCGTVVELFLARGRSYDAVYTCGPNPMMAALRKVLPGSVPAYASLEEYMACGVGACYGCTTGVETGNGVENQRVCREGPVFELHRIRFAS